MKTLHRLVTATKLPLALLAAAFGGVLLASAQSDREGDPHSSPRDALRRVPPPSRTARGDGPAGILNEDQRAQLRSLMAGGREHIRELEKKAQEARRGMQEAIFAEKFDERLAQERAGALGAIVAERAMTRARIFAKIRPSLTAGQLEKLRRHEPRNPNIEDGYGERRPPRLEIRPGDNRRREEYTLRERYAPGRDNRPDYRREAARPEPEQGRRPGGPQRRDEFAPPRREFRYDRTDPRRESRRFEEEDTDYRLRDPRRGRPDFRESDRDGREPRGEELSRPRRSPAPRGEEPERGLPRRPPSPADPEQP